MERVLAQEDPALGVNDRVPLHERVVRAHVRKALEGDMPAVKELYDRVDGKTADKHEVSGPEGGPVKVDLNDDTQVREVVRSLQFILEKAKKQPE
jgi:hypothetical protein